jgi:predicted MFS family arabinose efflux permease
VCPLLLIAYGAATVIGNTVVGRPADLLADPGVAAVGRDEPLRETFELP